MSRVFLPFFILIVTLSPVSCDPAEVSPQPDSPADVFAAGRLGGWEMADWELMEISPEADLRVYGLALPAPPRATVRALYHAVLVDSTGDGRPLPVDGPVQDVRLHASNRTLVAVLDAGGRLILWDAQTAQTVTLAESVFPGFSFSPDGRTLAYTAGVMPEMDLYVVDLQTREKLQLTDEDGPVWGPAFSPDGREVLFVTSLGGYPSLAMIPAGGGATRRLTNTDLPVDGSIVHSSRLAPFPDGRRPALWTSDGVFFENATGVHQIAMTGKTAAHWPGARFLVLKQGRIVHLEGRQLKPLGAAPEVLR